MSDQWQPLSAAFVTTAGMAAASAYEHNHEAALALIAAQTAVIEVARHVANSNAEIPGAPELSHISTQLVRDLNTALLDFDQRYTRILLLNATAGVLIGSGQANLAAKLIELARELRALAPR